MYCPSFRAVSGLLCVCLRYTATSSFGLPVFVRAAHSEAPIQNGGARKPCSRPKTLRNTRSSPYRGGNLLRKVFKSAVHRAPFTTAPYIPQSQLSVSPVTKHRTSIGLRGTDYLILSCYFRDERRKVRPIRSRGICRACSRRNDNRSNVVVLHCCRRNGRRRRAEHGNRNLVGRRAALESMVTDRRYTRGDGNAREALAVVESIQADTCYPRQVVCGDCRYGLVDNGREFGCGRRDIYIDRNARKIISRIGRNRCLPVRRYIDRLCLRRSCGNVCDDRNGRKRIAFIG